jgi:hypothetical protein
MFPVFLFQKFQKCLLKCLQSGEVKGDCISTELGI